MKVIRRKELYLHSSPPHNLKLDPDFSLMQEGSRIWLLSRWGVRRLVKRFSLITQASDAFDKTNFSYYESLRKSKEGMTSLVRSSKGYLNTEAYAVEINHAKRTYVLSNGTVIKDCD